MSSSLISFNPQVNIRVVDRYLEGRNDVNESNDVNENYDYDWIDENGLWTGWDYDSSSEEAFSSANFIREYQENIQNDQHQTIVQEINQRQNNQTSMAEEEMAPYEEDSDELIGAFIIEEGHK